ncbi:MATE family efflux transporter [Priestia megaterium]|jgi:multidrug resistance protein, MATE family|uniref:MATE family efflux transporter n=1 Tax=Priestia megaterium TaxID=1404 RepID=UPI001F21FEE9|nr:MATE family efflux transporter [Priestia megaterium]MCF8889045.1 MATE family efflux transporter [Priestia megaterium]
MQQTFSTSQKVKRFVFILFPILVTQFGMFSMTFFDTMMSGRVSADDLAGVAIGSSLWVPVFTGLSGILMSITPIVAQLVGANQKKKVPFSVIQGLYVSFLMAVVIILIGFFVVDPILKGMNLEANVMRIAKQYLIALSFGIIPLFIYTVLRNFIDALGQTRTSMLITILGLPVNVALNYVLIFGKLGFPHLGGVGSGYATAVTYWCILIVSIVIIHKKEPFSNFDLFKKFHRISFSTWKEILKIGLPIGFSVFFETSIFSAVTLFMSSYNTITIASHQAAINFASFLYMIPLSISMALTIVVGFEAGAKRHQDARSYSRIGVTIAVGMAFVCAGLLFTLRESVASLYTKDAEVLALTSHFLIYAIFFQLSDALQAPIQGALRGYKDVNVTFLMSLVSYWVIGLPLGIVLAKYTDLQAFGYWIGLIAGLAAGATGLAYRLIKIQKKQLLEENKSSRTA